VRKAHAETLAAERDQALLISGVRSCLCIGVLASTCLFVGLGSVGWCGGGTGGWSRKTLDGGLPHDTAAVAVLAWVIIKPAAPAGGGCGGGGGGGPRRSPPCGMGRLGRWLAGWQGEGGR
jgi:hypothetical protein